MKKKVEGRKRKEKRDVPVKQLKGKKKKSGGRLGPKKSATKREKENSEPYCDYICWLRKPGANKGLALDRYEGYSFPTTILGQR